MTPFHKPVHPRACGEQARGNLALPVCANPVHPRACGEQCLHRSHNSVGMVIGSSPRLREQAIVGLKPTQVYGSSPRLRGTGNRVLRNSLGCRFIPAPAGNSPRSRLPAVARTTVHPRACGEQSIPSHVRLHGLDCGSSPRLRGTGCSPAGAWGRRPGRFIPAPAGNSPVRPWIR